MTSTFRHYAITPATSGNRLVLRQAKAPAGREDSAEPAGREDSAEPAEAEALAGREEPAVR